MGRYLTQQNATSIATLGAAVLAIGSLAVGAAPAHAGTVILDTSVQAAGSGFIDSSFADIANNLVGSNVVPSGVFAFDETSIFPSVVNDDPQQYEDGDVSVGIDLVYQILGLNFDSATINTLNTLFTVDVSGGGTLSNGTESIDFNLSYDSDAQEVLATLVNFDPQNNFIASCLTVTCTTTGDFGFDLLLGPLTPVSFRGDFLVVTTPQVSGNPDSIPSGNDPVQTVPEPATFLGLLGTAGLLATRRKRSQ